LEGRHFNINAGVTSGKTSTLQSEVNKMKSLKSMAAATTVTLALTAMSMTGLAQQQTTPDGSAELARTLYSGGALEGVRKVAENSPTTTTSHTFINVPGAATSWFVAANDSDLLNVSFTGECRLIGNAVPPAGAANWVELRVMISRVPALAGFPTFMQPYDVGSPMAFCSANDYAMHAANFAARVAGGTTGATYTAQVQYRVTGAAGLTAWLDDYMMELLAFN
jgi:hypothetical protein